MSLQVAPRRSIVALALALILTLGLLVGGTGTTLGERDDPDDIQGEDHWIESHDGTGLAATLWFNTSHIDEPRPVILAGHGWSQDRHHMTQTARWLVDQGFIVLTWDARGFGESEGTVGLNGPDEWEDVSALIDWLGDPQSLPQGPEILLDGPNDPRIGMVGASYGGAIQLLAAAHDDRIDAIVPDITWNDLVHSLAPHGVVKRGWVDLLYFSGTGASHGFFNTPPDPNTGGMDPRLTEWFLEASLTGRLPDDAIEPLLERSPATHMDRIHTPALITQGWHDTLFWPDEAVATYLALSGREDTSTHLMLYPGGHGHSLHPETRSELRAQTQAFLAHHLKDAEQDPLPAVALQKSPRGAWTHLETWPPETEETPVPLHADGTPETRTLLVLPAATSHTEHQNFHAEAGDHSQDLLSGEEAATAIRLDLGQTGPLTLQGAPRLELSVTPESDDVTLFFSLVQRIDDDAEVLYNQVRPLRLESPGETTWLNLTLSHLAHTLSAGKTLELRITTSDTAYHQARSAGTIQLHLEDAQLILPISETQTLLRDEGEAEGQQEDAPLPMMIAMLAVLVGVFQANRSRPGS